MVITRQGKGFNTNVNLISSDTYRLDDNPQRKKKTVNIETLIKLRPLCCIKIFGINMTLACCSLSTGGL